MPIYTFRCPECEFEEETLLSHRELDKAKFSCPKCCTFMQRIIDAPTIGKSAYQMGAILSSGEHVSGHFGKYAKRK
jgi:putative FmdB family regulatory protein